MVKKEQKTTAFMTAGEIAAKAGLTIRTVQYYDQQGLLTPSARGSRNLRLYTEEDLDRLYQILCYKFIGLTLKEIREKLQEEEPPERIVQMLHEEVLEEENRLSEEIRRYAVLKNLEDYTNWNQMRDWEEYADLIRQFQEKWKLIWEVNRIQEDGARDQAVLSDNEGLQAFYTLAADALRLMRQGVPPESEEALRIMERFNELNAAEKAKDLIFVDPDIMDLKAMDYSNIWKGLKDYMTAAQNYYKETKAKE